MRSFHCHQLFTNPTHKKLVSLGTQGTAAKIILKIIYDWMETNNHANHQFELERMSLIINNLAKAIENVINYPLYQKLSSQNKENIKTLLSRDLLEFVKKKSDAFQEIGSAILKNKKVPHFGKTKSLNEFVSVVKEKPTKFYITFPDKPFKMVNELEDRIIATLKDKYIYLLIDQDEDNNNLLNKSQLLSKKILHHSPFPAEKILDEIIKKWQTDNPDDDQHAKLKIKDHEILTIRLQNACTKAIDYKYYKKQPGVYKTEVFELLVNHLMQIAKTADCELINNFDHSLIKRTGIQYFDGNIHQDHQFTSLSSLQGNSPIWIKFPDTPFYTETELCIKITEALYAKHNSLLNPLAVRELSQHLSHDVNVTKIISFEQTPIIDTYVNKETPVEKDMFNDKEESKEEFDDVRLTRLSRRL